MNTLKSFIRPLKLLAIAFVFSLVLWANSNPAYAFGSSKTSPAEGEADLSNIERMSEKAIESNSGSSDTVKDVAKGGLNGVQGDADKDKMIGPEDAAQADTVKDEIESGIKSMVGKN